jgi:hypothetical protein
MTFSTLSVRRNEIRRDDLPVVWTLAVCAGVGGALAGCRPTGQPAFDVALTGVVSMLTVWLGASASWWSLCAAGWVAALAAGTAPGLAAGVAAALIGMYLGSQRRNKAWARSLGVALVVQVVLRLHVNPFFGCSAVIGGTVLVSLWTLCIIRRRRVVGRRVRRGLLIAGGIALVAAGSFAARVAVVGSDLQKGYQGVLDGLSQLQDGDAAGAAATLHEAADELGRVADAADSVFTQPARLVPVVAQHRNALATVVAQASSAAESAATALDTVDLDSLTIEQGVVDIVAVAALADPLTDLYHAVENLQGAIDDANSPWLVAPAAERLHRYQRRAEQATVQARAGAAAARIGPALLGATERRTYLVGFMSPAEARGAIGMMGNYSVITIEGGLISRTDFGRVNALSNEIDHQGGVDVDVSAEFARRYGGYVLDARGRASHSLWSNVTMTPDVPSAAALMAQVWAETGHDPVDGVFLIDPAGLSALLQATGPIQVPGLEQPLDANTVEHFLYIDQYQSDTPERTDLLEKVATATLDAVLGGQLPAPQQLARLLGPAATGGDLVGWARRPNEQELMRLIGMDGGFPTLNGRDGLAVVSNNASANKIDSFIERTIAYNAEVHDGEVHATVTITLHNTAPASGYPTYVIGSEFLDIPPGTNRTLLSVYSPLDRTSATLDGEAVGLSNGSELGWQVYTLRLDLAPGQTRTLSIELTGTVDRDGYALVVRPQPMAIDDAYSIHVTGDAHVDHVGPVNRRSVVDARGIRADARGTSGVG